MRITGEYRVLEVLSTMEHSFLWREYAMKNFIRILKQGRQYWKYLIVAGISLLAITAFNLVTPWKVRELVDILSKRRHEEYGKYTQYCNYTCRCIHRKSVFFPICIAISAMLPHGDWLRT